jgi:hypothetical protein
MGELPPGSPEEKEDEDEEKGRDAARAACAVETHAPVPGGEGVTAGPTSFRRLRP